MWLTVLILSFILFGHSQAGNNDGKCEIEKFTDSSWLVYLVIPGKVYDNENNKVVYESSYTGNLADLKCTCTSTTCNSNYEYITITNDESSFIISTSDHMTDLDKDTEKTNNPSIKLVYSCEMKCNTDLPSILPVVIDIYDYNNHAPEFEVDSYTYKVATPIMPMSDFTLFGSTIEVEDLDFSNTNITFTIEPNDFNISTTVDYTNNKKYIANVRANRAIVLTESVTYKLTATDSGEDPNHLDTTVDIIIDIDESLSWDVPSFEYSDESIAGYVFEYVSSSDQLNPLTGPIKLNTNKPNSIEDLQLLGEMKDYFTVEYVNETQTFELSSTTIENPTSTSTILTLSLKTDFEVSTPIIIRFSEVSSDTVSFKEHSYTGTYDDANNIVTMDDDIVLTISTSGTPTFAVTGDFSDNFIVEYDENTKICKLTVSTALTPAEILSKVYLTLTLQATVDDDSDRTVIIIQLPTHTLEFTEILYTATYNDDNNTVSVDAASPIAFTADATGVIITVEEPYSTYFKVNEKLTIDVEEPLPSGILTTEAEIAIVLTAEDLYSNKVKSVVKMALPLQETIEAPKFSQPYYTVEYSNTEEYIDFAVALTFDNIEDPSLVFIELSDYINNFEVVYTEQKWRLHVKSPLDNTVLDVKQDLILIMSAKQTETNRTGKSVLIIELIEDSVDVQTPQFEDAYYTAIYPDDGKGPISFVNDIIFDNIDDVSKINITISDYDENFIVSYDTTSTKWLIDILTPLDVATLSSNTYLTSTLTAKIEGDDEHTPVAGFVLKLPVQEVPVFSKSYYVAQYTIEDDEAKVTFVDQIEFSNEVDVDKIEIISDEYSDYLSFEYNTEKNQWEVKTNGILDTTSLDRLNLVVAVTATDTVTNLQGHSVIDLKLPKVNEEDSPRFSKTYYKANYDLSTSQPNVILEDSIDFLNRDDMTTISITTNNYTENFNVSYVEEKWEITVTKNLDQSILNNKVDIIMELIASDSTDSTSIGQATLLITLPVINNDDAPKFSSIFYESQCNSTTKILETIPTITINNKEDLSKINVSILENDYQSNFEIQYKSATQSWEISVISLPEDVEKLGKSLVLTLTASEPENTNIGQSALIINFPALDAPKFSSDQYFGNYEIIEDISSFTMDDVIITNRDNQNNIALMLSSPDEDLTGKFKYSFDDEKKIWKITLNQSLDDDFINGKTELILTLTASEDYNSNEGFATVIISLPTEETENDLTFSSIHYEGNYSIVENEAVVELNEKIQLISTKDLTSVLFSFVVTDNIDANDYFSIDETNNAGYYDVKVLKELPPSILQNQRNLLVTLQATLGGSKTSTTLVINLPIPGEENTIEFSKLLYNGNYCPDYLGVEDITIITNEVSGNLEVTISKDSPYESYFGVVMFDKTVTLTAEVIPSDVLEGISVIPLTLQAFSSGTSKTGRAIVNIDTRCYRGSVQFSSLVFNGKYDVNDNDTLTTDRISLITDVEDELISVTLNNAMDSYFHVFYNSSEVTLSLVSNIPDEFLQNSTLTLVLTATILTDTDVKSQAVVNLRIISDTQPDTDGYLKFDDVLFTAQYSVQNGKGIFKQDGDIGLSTDRLDKEIDIQISEASHLEEHFNISYENQKITVSLKDNIPDDVFHSKNLISLTMTASTTSISTSAVLNVILNNDGIDNGYIYFESAVYNGKYTVENNMAAIDYDNNITVNTDQEDSKILATIEQPYNAYFNVVYLNKLIKLDLLTTSASTTLRRNKNLPVVVTVQIKDTSEYSSTVINFVVVDTDNGDVDNGPISFPSQVYNGVYDVDENRFTRDVIRIITDHPDGDIEVKISNEYNYDTYFEVEYKINEVIIGLKKALPKNDVKNLGSIALAIRARLKNHQTIYGDSVLNIKIQDKSLNNEGSSNTKYIIAVSVLSVLLFLVIIGVIAIYVFIFRNRKYEKMTEDDYISSKVKFDRSAMKRPSTERTRSSAIEERRPTGFVFTNTDSEDVKDSNADSWENTRKKSVAFDENVEKLQIEGVNDEDIERALGETTEL